MATDAQIDAFKQRWLGSEAAERSNSQLFLTELTDLMGVPHPAAARKDAKLDHYVFERHVKLAHPGGERAGFIDLYKRGCFVLESKQGANELKKGGFAKRDTPSWENEMEKARGQAIGYAQTLEELPPFIVVCDVGHVFEIHASFDGTAHWTAFPAPPANRLYLRDLDAKRLELLRTVWTDPRSLDPSRHQAQVSRDVATKLAALARSLENAGNSPEAVARFLMRCIFTMFAEDIGLFPDKKKLFQEYLQQHWVNSPSGFPGGVQAFWSTMNTGGMLPTGVALKRFNGGLFADPSGLVLSRSDLNLLLMAATHDWSQVEPAIFGTLLERALDPKERHRLGAHYTPRAYVERLIRPTLEEPLRADWLVAQADARRLREAGKTKDAAKVLQAFHKELCHVRVLDPACGSGNFLYVALDLMKQLEAEVREELWRLGDQNELLEFDGTTVRPSQFLGIEKKRWAKEIAELVLWIGYLRWHFRAKGDRGEVQVPDPVLENYENIQCRDAVLDWDGAPIENPVTDECGRPVTRWDGETTKPDPITGKPVPDERATVVVFEYPNARRATWPEADFIVGNPPFVGNKRMRLVLGAGYVDALRRAHDQVPESADYVMYWWSCAANLLRAGVVQRFGLITTNSITQTYNRRVVQDAIGDEKASIVFAIADHPWVDSESGAAVRIAMTTGAPGFVEGMLLTVLTESKADDETVSVALSASRGLITPGLRIGVSPSAAVPLAANRGLSFMGVTLDGDAFVLSSDNPLVLRAAPSRVPRYLIGRDLTRRDQKRRVIDLFGLTVEDAASQEPDLYQHVLVGVKPTRDAKASRSKDAAAYARDWWLFAKTRPAMRAALKGLPRFVATCRTAQHRTFVFVEMPALVESTVIAIASDDGFVLGVLSSRLHLQWATHAGSVLEDRPRYNNSKCFDPFPFPDASDAQTARIRDLAERLDAHRKRQLEKHPKLTITAMYNVLERLRTGAELGDKDRAIHEQGLVSVLRQFHDQLDAAVLDAYGWPARLSDEELLERLLALNAERAAEEARGIVRWLRPVFQAPEAEAPAQVAVPEPEAAPVVVAAAAKPGKWPKAFPERVALVRDVVLASAADATFSVEEVARRFKRAKRDDVQAILETFVALGRLVSFEDPRGDRRWARPGPAA